MIGAAKSVQYFGMYLVFEGILLLIIPDFFLNLFLLQAADVWVRITGLCLMILGYFYFNMGNQNVRPFLVLSTHTRTFQFIILGIFVALEWIGPTILIAGGVELLAGIWTFFELRNEARTVRK
ncbi:PF09838 family protein [Leptospira fainei serovar Hurstbridge str. BUT 6]|uniref:PF09838 family protein n=1 Tax=Leptospira fainei serovar Hurstbridge str. BUT 6 TaxID=1193011 RepID=S3UX10_9LEPT|nr:DUF2065 family protein [Leptospira fainei]EPG72889.1 PF09838 family protein [Leptospira fainei serovar Hurstbridge str. BUT 6]